MFQNDELHYVIELNSRGFLPSPETCACGNKTFYIQEDSYYVTSNCIFRCKNKNCRKRYQIRCNSFFKYFPKIKLRIISEIIKAFICREMNAPSIVNFLKSNYNIDINIVTVRDILNEIRKVFY